MEIELGIRNVAGAVTFNTDEPADQVGAAINQAIANHEPITSLCPQTPSAMRSSALRPAMRSGSAPSTSHHACGSLKPQAFHSGIAPRSTIFATVSSSVRFSPKAFGLPAPCQSEPPVTSRW